MLVYRVNGRIKLVNPVNEGDWLIECEQWEDEIELVGYVG